MFKPHVPSSELPGDPQEWDQEGIDAQYDHGKNQTPERK